MANEKLKSKTEVQSNKTEYTLAPGESADIFSDENPGAVTSIQLNLDTQGF